jgi:uncharacterized protein
MTRLIVLARDTTGRATRVQVSHDAGIKVGDVRLTGHGYMIAENVPVARTGVQEYSAFELGLDVSMKTVRLYRAPEEVFSAVSMATLDRKPITYYHPERGVDASNWKSVTVGRVEAPAQDGDFLDVGRFEVNDGETVKAIAFGVKEVSCGYSFMLDMTAGTTPKGEGYDGVQLQIEYDHVAVVYDGRCGGGCAIGDCACSSRPDPHSSTEESTMKIKVSGIDIELNDKDAAIVQREIGDLTTARDGALKRATDAEGALTTQGEAMKKMGSDHKTALDAAEAKALKPEQVQAMVAELASVIGDAKGLLPEIVTDGKTAGDIRVEVLTAIAKDEKLKDLAAKLLRGSEPAKASDVLVHAAFDAVVAVGGRAATGTGSEYERRVKDALSGGGTAAPEGARVIKYPANAHLGPATKTTAAQ